MLKRKLEFRCYNRKVTKTNSKIISLQDLKYLQPLFQEKKTVLVGGCFDLLHYGHWSFLSKAKNAGDYLIVALESDEFIKKQKNRSPIHSQKERADILAALDVVNLVVILPYFSSNEEYEGFVKQVRPNIIAITQGDPQTENKQKQVCRIGGVLQIVTPVLGDFSTQKIISKLL